jgi:hypothetical protein
MVLDTTDSDRVLGRGIADGNSRVPSRTCTDSDPRPTASDRFAPIQHSKLDKDLRSPTENKTESERKRILRRCSGRSSETPIPSALFSKCDSPGVLGEAFAQELQIAAIGKKREQDQISDSTASCSHSQRGGSGFSNRRSHVNSNRVSDIRPRDKPRIGNEHLRWRLLCCVRR